MKTRKTWACIGVLYCLCVTGCLAQRIDRTKYPDHGASSSPDSTLLLPMGRAGSRIVGQRPDHVNNAENKYFPFIFNQDGGSCGSASAIDYRLGYELNAYRRLNGKLSENTYPTHFTWLLTFGNSSKEIMSRQMGVPTADVYGGRTYSQLFGNQDASDYDFGWMTGYGKWHSAMFNRALREASIPAHLGTEEGREALKNWLWNHNGDNLRVGRLRQDAEGPQGVPDRDAAGWCIRVHSPFRQPRGKHLRQLHRSGGGRHTARHADAREWGTGLQRTPVQEQRLHVQQRLLRTH